MATENLKGCKLPGTDQIIAESIKAGSRTIHPETHKLINPIRSKEQAPQTWRKSIILPTQEKKYKTDCTNYRPISLLPTTYKN
jgi:hypothetical protein